jgi:dihydroneopterin aldolase
MSDLIRVVDLEISTHIGVPDEERAEPQKLLVSLELSVAPFGPAAKTDDIGLTVNYYDVAQRVKAVAHSRPWKLLETLAEVIAADLLEKFPIGKIGLEIKKFILLDAHYVSVRIERTR